MGTAVDEERTAHDGAIAAVADAPDLVTQEHDGFGAGPIVIGDEVAPERRPHAQRREQLP